MVRPIVALPIGLVLMATLTAARASVKQQGDTWLLENRSLKVRVWPARGLTAVLDKAAGFEWVQPGGPWPAFSDVRATPGSDNLQYTVKMPSWNSPERELRVQMTLRGRELAFRVTPASPADTTNGIPLVPCFALRGPRAVLAAADYSNGHLYPLEADPFPREWLTVNRLDMPWVGVTDLDRGHGYIVIVDTTDDMTVAVRKHAHEGGDIRVPQLIIQPSKGTLAYARAFRYEFAARGGYVALALAYRRTARSQGLLVTLADKARKNPEVKRLFGAPDVWGNPSLEFAREARAAGVAKMLIQGWSSSEQMKEINGQGYLTSEYDNYTDVQPLKPGQEVDAQHDRLPDHAVLGADGNRMKAWITMEGLQYMKRCPTFWKPTAEATIPKLLRTRPYIGRFIDVTTAEGLYECFDPAHPLTHAQKRQCGVDLLSYVRSLGLVVGGEHGIWWAVPHVDFFEGMMSGGYAAWPAGHLIRPTSRQQKFTMPGGWDPGPWSAYDRWGIGHQWRAPLWELVFHDCVVTTWYWGDSTDFLLQAAPELTAAKNAYNVLYGTIPLLWASKEGSWSTHRGEFLRAYRNTCKLHEVIATTAMTDHAFLTSDHHVQRTRFSDGTTVVANFGNEPYSATLSGRTYLLPQYGWAVRGPRIQQSRELRDGKVVTTIRAGAYRYTETE